MPHIRGTPFIVDDFRFRPSDPQSKNLFFFLSHFHADHYPGLSSTFETGPIFCSPQTATIMLNKFPKIKAKVTPVEYNQPIELTLANQKKAKVTFMDANHIIGSAMILFEGFFGRILYSGDLRYHDKLILLNTPLFNPDGSTKLRIDELILDNTYCDPIFSFPGLDACVQILAEIIRKNLEFSGKKLKVHMYCYTVGKEEIAIELAKIFRTRIVLDADRFRMIKKLDYYPNYFTRFPSEGFIYLSKGLHDEAKFHEEHRIHINLTGWINCQSYISLKKNEYLVAYSSHSNYPELDRFVSLIRPGELSTIVIHRGGENTLHKARSFSNYLFSLRTMKQRGLQLLRDKYVDRSRLSEDYRKLFEAKELGSVYRDLGIEGVLGRMKTRGAGEEREGLSIDGERKELVEVFKTIEEIPKQDLEEMASEFMNSRARLQDLEAGDDREVSDKEIPSTGDRKKSSEISEDRFSDLREFLRFEEMIDRESGDGFPKGQVLLKSLPRDHRTDLPRPKGQKKVNL